MKNYNPEKQLCDQMYVKMYCACLYYKATPGEMKKYTKLF